jgi:uroporphyrinogen-III synthase
MRIWVTRPKTAGERTAARLAALGHDPIVLPLASADHTPENALQALGNRPSCLAITSAQTLGALALLGENLKPFLDIPVFAVGHATAQAAREAGFQHVHPANGTAEDLAECLVNAMANRDGHVLYLAGHPRSDRLETRLQDQGIRFQTAESYYMRPVPYAEKDLESRFGNSAPDVVLLYSRETALLFFSLPVFARGYKLLLGCWICCFSPNVAAGVPQELKHRIKIADEPNEQALFALLKQIHI